MSRSILATFAYGDYLRIGEITFPQMRQYASNFGLDFHHIDWMEPGRMPSWFWMGQIHDLLDEYDRVFFVSVDCIVRPDAMNVLELPTGVFYGFDELPFDDAPLNEGIGLKIWEHAMADWPDEFAENTDYPKHLYNTGVILVDKSHQKLFAPVSNETDHGMQEMGLINMRIHKYGMAHRDLYPDVFNASHMWKEEHPTPSVLHIMHYGKLYDAASKVDGIQRFMPKMGY